MERITKAQQIYLSLIEAGGQWNNFDGCRIAADLQAHLPLWRSAIITRLPKILDGAAVTELRDRVNLIILRDLPADDINLDTLFLLPEPDQQDELEHVVRTWSCAEIAWISTRESLRAMGASKFKYAEYPPDNARFLLRAWWD